MDNYVTLIKTMEQNSDEKTPLLSQTKNKVKKPTMRNHWFQFVAKTRKRLQRGKKEKVTHREAMRQASLAWVTEKEKVKRRLARAARKAAKQKKL